MGTDLDREAIVDLVPTAGPDGRTTWVPTELVERDTGIIVKPGGTITTVTSGMVAPLSTMPTERMSADGNWDRIVRSMQDAEAGRSPRDEIVVQPGGALVPVSRGTAGAQLSKMPEVRMAASKATSQDLAEARTLDPANVEGWTFIEDPVIPGLQFHMSPVARRFTFFTFRSPSHSGHWFVAPLSPRFDDLLGHQHHMVRLSLGGESVPVVCRNATTSAHPTLKEVRGTAAKFAAYHDFRGNGHTPFSA